MLSEISMTETPANLKCRVQSRRPVRAFDLALLGWRRSVVEGYDLMRKQLDVFARMAAEIDRQLKAAPKTPPAAPVRKRYATREWPWATGSIWTSPASPPMSSRWLCQRGGQRAWRWTPMAMSLRAEPSRLDQRKGLTGPRGVKLLAFHDWHKPAGVIKRWRPTPGGNCRSRHN